MIPLDLVLRREGVATAPVAGWETRGRPYSFTPAGVMVHHTAGRSSLGIIVNGRTGIPGPLAQLLIDKTGLTHVVSRNYCNHAGQGNSDVLTSARAEAPPRFDRHPLDGDIVGNRFFYGIEVENLGKSSDPYPPEQIDALVKSCRAILGWHQWHPNRIRHHRQWTHRKVDMSWTGDLIALVAGTVTQEEADMILTRPDWRRVQDDLKVLEYAPGKSDGIPGAKTLAAVRAFQADAKLDQSTAFVYSPNSYREKSLPAYTVAKLSALAAAVPGAGTADEALDLARSAGAAAADALDAVNRIHTATGGPS